MIRIEPEMDQTTVVKALVILLVQGLVFCEARSRSKFLPVPISTELNDNYDMNSIPVSGENR